MQIVRRLAALVAASRSNAEPVAFQAAVRPAAIGSNSPQPLDAGQLKLVGGGVTNQAPVNRW